MKIHLDEIKKDYHDTCYRCGSENLPESPWCVFKEDGVTVAPICEKCSSKHEIGKVNEAHQRENL